MCQCCADSRVLPRIRLADYSPLIRVSVWDTRDTPTDTRDTPTDPCISIMMDPPISASPGGPGSTTCPGNPSWPGTTRPDLTQWARKDTWAAWTPAAPCLSPALLQRIITLFHVSPLSPGSSSPLQVAAVPCGGHDKSGRPAFAQQSGPGTQITQRSARHRPRPGNMVGFIR